MPGDLCLRGSTDVPLQFANKDRVSFEVQSEIQVYVILPLRPTAQGATLSLRIVSKCYKVEAQFFVFVSHFTTKPNRPSGGTANV